MSVLLRNGVRRVVGDNSPVYRIAVAAAHPTHRGERFAATWRAFKYETQTRVFGRPSTVPLGARSRVVVRKGETNAPHILMHNPPNWPEMLVWKKVLSPGSLFIDVGANIGIYSIYAAEQGADVIAVEPHPESAARVREHFELNNYPGQVLEKALSDCPGIVRLTANLDSLNHLVDTGGIEVESTTLDLLIGDRRAGVKIDVQGAEELVLEGARLALAEHRLDPIQLEWGVERHEVKVSRDPVKAILDSYGYRLYGADHNGGLVPLTSTPGTLNVFARPAR